MPCSAAERDRAAPALSSALGAGSVVAAPAGTVPPVSRAETTTEAAAATVATVTARGREFLRGGFTDSVLSALSGREPDAGGG
ncbi:hypothetical protein GCM10018772_22020 [Streptomyces fumanus]|uniref:Uncharacterized protein n=1 Tax=Streptomyces fumanus TaxID=67302 RepID=A0A919DY75_9ACTN|nr:hypothetical protein GCM10018772_22020 [Streptomyces fumanus]